MSILYSQVEYVAGKGRGRMANCPDRVDVVCARQTDPFRVHEKGAVRRACHYCGETVIVGKATLVHVGTRPARFFCLECLHDLAVRGHKVRLYRVEPPPRPGTN
jgi:hypothetical protein